MSTPSPVVTLRLDDRVLAELDARAEAGSSEDARVTHGRGSVVREMLDDYLALLARTRRELRRRELFSDDECSVITDALNGCKHTPGLIGELAIGVEDAIELEGLTGSAVLPVDFKGLVKKLQVLTPIEEIAILDAAVRWWNRVAAGEENVVASELLK